MKDQKKTAPKKAKKKAKKKDDPEVARAKKNLGIESEEEKEQREHNERVEQQAATDAANAPHINRKTFPKSIFITLEPEEAHDANRRLLQALDDVDAREKDKADVVKEANEHIKEAEAVVLAIRNELKNGRTEVVEVEEVKDFDAGTYMLSRTDTNEVLERRELTDNERQPDLNMESPASGAFHVGRGRP